MSVDFNAQAKATQQTLVDFLQAELKIGSTLAQSASLAADDGHFKDYDRARNAALKAMEAVRRFAPQVTDSNVQAEITRRLGELERVLADL